MRTWLALAVLVLVPRTSSAQQTKSSAPGAQKQGAVVVQGTRPPWELTDEQRIAARVIAGTQSGHIRGAAAAPGKGYSENIDGRQNPELFFAYELFDRVLLGLSSDQKQAANAHRLYDAKLSAYGYDKQAFWETLRSAAQPYLIVRAHRDTNGPHHTLFTSSTGQRTVVPIAQDACAARIKALDQARRVLRGFDHFLYAAVAPEVGTSSSGTVGDRGEQLRYMAVGCR